ncbi:ArpU family phage packaging/lysis transcriptional regulator [Sporosarcina sp. OR05]|uniref:ArpU family phage packaging/lysis transcriptional regulator n=1 Tax=Sporosarcina sp. OR05 TaxID=2969819 RepID=UPI00352A9EF1
MSEQLQMFEEIDEKAVRSVVIKELRLYRALKVQLENIEERSEHGVVDLYPVFRKVSPENRLKVQQMERALNHSLDGDERRIIEMKYLSDERNKDISVYMDLGMKKDKYYEVKQQAIKYLATALGII